LGIAFVAGRKRVPIPATGKTALRIFINNLPPCPIMMYRKFFFN
jgi:hypothetical protein